MSEDYLELTEEQTARGWAYGLDNNVIFQKLDNNVIVHMADYGDGVIWWLETVPYKGPSTVEEVEAASVQFWDELRASASRFTYCAYCAKSFPAEKLSTELIGEHIKTCPKHPMRKLEERIRELESEAR